MQRLGKALASRAGLTALDRGCFAEESGPVLVGMNLSREEEQSRQMAQAVQMGPGWREQGLLGNCESYS